MPRYLKSMILMSACAVFFFALPAFASPKSVIRIGAYNFPPIAMVDEDNQANGLLGDLLDALRTQQDTFSFEVIHTSPRRRYLDFSNGLFDVMFFENPDWSWNQDDINFSAPMLKDEEVYIALKKDNRDQSFFDNLSERRIVAIAGYHYGFAGFETDSEELSKRFNIELSHSHRRNLKLIRADRPSVAEVAVVSRSFLNTYLSRFPEHRDDLLISEQLDQTYQLRVITRKNGPVGVDTIEGLLQPLIDSGRYQELVREHGLQLPRNIAGTH
ncbi:substrate-binding periplasmic protein [Marinobacter halotolerans]|uniref:substrate-binding periplasmic protein n=1 Tax=Marinobacter halotolerans TaxID=1569211 RepID=UPI001CDA4B78|nr:transporter substrate-binding domain-containing protein [Marinobacter halotolerans]